MKMQETIAIELTPEEVTAVQQWAMYDRLMGDPVNCSIQSIDAKIEESKQSQPRYRLHKPKPRARS